jgi:hypothetical protein
MPTDLEERRTQLLAELERQNLTWVATQKKLSRLGGGSLAVPRAFFEELDVLGPPPARPLGIRG